MRRCNRPIKLAFLSAVIALSPAFAAHATGAEAATPPVSFALQTLKEENVEGPDVERTYFTVGADRIAIGKPQGCQVRVEENSLVLVLTGLGLDGEIRISQSPFTSDFDLAQNALKYRDSGASTIPRGSERIEVQSPVMNLYPFNGWKSLGFTWTYSFRGRAMNRTVGYINLEVGAQVVVTTLASRADAEKVEATAKQFISSWWVMKRAKS